MVVLKNKEKNIYFKSHNGITGEVKFTDFVNEAKGYDTEWFAKTELDYLRFHYPELGKEYLNKMTVAYAYI